MKYRFLYLVISSSVLLPGIYFMLRFGFRPAIDFTGGALIEIKINQPKKEVNSEELQKLAQQAQIEIGSIQTSGVRTYILKLKPIEEKQKTELVAKIQAEYGIVELLRFETVGPTLGKELLQKMAIAAGIAMIIILLYIARAFKDLRFGVAAIIALLHDVLVVMGIFAVLGVVKKIEVDSLFVTAVLTTMSFSVHDTIVVFDRIRELQKKGIAKTFAETVNHALTETMGRSLNNSLTIFFMLLALALLGGETIRWFAVALLIGTISGTYSSPFVAAPILFVWHQLRDKNKN